MKNLSISTRMVATFGAIMALLLAIVTLSIVNMGSMWSGTQEITGNWMPSVEHVNQMNTATSDFRIAEMQHVMNTDEAAMARIEKTMAVVLGEFETQHQAYIKLISSDEEQKLHDSFAADWKQYLQIHAQVLGHSRKNENADARTLLEGESQVLFDRSSATLDKLIELNHKGAVDAGESSRVTHAWARNSLLGLAASPGVT